MPDPPVVEWSSLFRLRVNEFPDRRLSGANSAACLGAALLSALIFPMRGPGLGILIAGIAVGAAFYSSRRPMSVQEWAFGTCGVGMLAFTSIRAAEWLDALL